MVIFEPAPKDLSRPNLGEAAGATDAHADSQWGWGHYSLTLYSTCRANNEMSMHKVDDDGNPTTLTTPACRRSLAQFHTEVKPTIYGRKLPYNVMWHEVEHLGFTLTSLEALFGQPTLRCGLKSHFLPGRCLQDWQHAWADCHYYPFELDNTATYGSAGFTCLRQ